MFYIGHSMSLRRWVWCHSKMGVISVEMFWWHRCSWCSVWYRGVMSFLKWMWHHKYCCLVWYSVCDIICSVKDVTYMPSVVSSTQRVVMSYLVDIMSYIQRIWFHRYTGCDTIYIVAVMSSIGWVWWHRCSGSEVRYSGLDVIHKVVWCPKEWMWCHTEEIWCHE